jgi:hypothetical protein
MTVISKTRVEGGNGLSIQLDRGRIKYSIGGRNIQVEIEHGVGEVSVYKSSISKWYPPHSAEPIDDAERQKILADIEEALKLMGVGCVIE